MAEAIDDGIVDDPETVSRYVHQILLDSERLTVMVRDLLDLSVDRGAVFSLPLEPAPLASEQSREDRSRSTLSVGPRSPTSDLARVAGMPADDEVVDAALRLVTALTRATVGDADGVSVSLTRHGQMITVAASDDTIAQMDREQYATGEGPCLSAAAEGHWFHVESLAEETRWPHFIPLAAHDGIASILSTPLVVSDRPVGALNIYSNTERAFGPQDRELAALFASEASAILQAGGAHTSSDEAAARLRGALSAREVIAQAQGVIMGRQGLSAEAAYATLRQSAKEAGETVRSRATGIVSRTHRGDLIGKWRP